MHDPILDSKNKKIKKCRLKVPFFCKHLQYTKDLNFKEKPKNECWRITFNNKHNVKCQILKWRIHFSNPINLTFFFFYCWETLLIKFWIVKRKILLWVTQHIRLPSLPFSRLSNVPLFSVYLEFAFSVLYLCKPNFF